MVSIFDVHHPPTGNRDRCVGGSFFFERSTFMPYLIPPNYCRRASRLLAAMKVALGLMGSSISGDGLKPYLRPPAPPPSPFVKYPSSPSEDKTRAPPAPHVAAHKLIRPLLSARLEAERALIEYLRTADLPQEHPSVEIRHCLEDLALRSFKS